MNRTNILPLPGRFHLLLALTLAVFAARVSGAPAVTPILREGQARYSVLDPAKLPPGTDPKLFAAVVSGNSFDVFVRELPAQQINIELGFVDTAKQSRRGEHLLARRQRHAARRQPGRLEQGRRRVQAVGLQDHLRARRRGAGDPFRGPDPAGFRQLRALHGCERQGTGIRRRHRLAEKRTAHAAGLALAALSTRSRWAKCHFSTWTTARSGRGPLSSTAWSKAAACRFASSRAATARWCRIKGIIVAVKNGEAERIMPFTANQKSLPPGALVTDKETVRTLGACTDRWQIPLGVSWTHYTPVWAMKDWATASPEERRRFVLPVTWMQFHVDNRAGKAETRLLFSLQQDAQRAEGLKGFDGYTVAGDSTIAVPTGDAELLSADQARQAFGVEGATSAFCVRAAPGTEKTVTFYVAHYKHGVESELEKQPLTMMYDALYTGLDDILKTAQASLPAVVGRCEETDRKLANSPEDDERKFLCRRHAPFLPVQHHPARHAQAGTRVGRHRRRMLVHQHVRPDRRPRFLRTGDAPVDGAQRTRQFPRLLLVHGRTLAARADAIVPGRAGLFPRHGLAGQVHQPRNRRGVPQPDDAGRIAELDPLRRALLEIDRRRHLAPSEQVGVRARAHLDGTTRRPGPRQARRNHDLHVPRRRAQPGDYDLRRDGRVAPAPGRKSLYRASNPLRRMPCCGPVFAALHDSAEEQRAQAAEAYTAKGLLSHWDEGRQRFPAAFNGTSDSAIIPAIEGLIYPYAMGLTEDVALDGPNADFIKHLKTHMATILVPGVCIDAKTKGWNLSSSSSTTWLSKVYLNQFITEHILGMKNAATGHDADAAHYAYEVLGAPAVGWTDQIYTSTHIAYGCRHYPRGVTSALWWLYAPSGKAL